MQYHLVHPYKTIRNILAYKKAKHCKVSILNNKVHIIETILIKRLTGSLQRRFQKEPFDEILWPQNLAFIIQIRALKLGIPNI